MKISAEILSVWFPLFYILLFFFSTLLSSNNV